MWLVRVVPTPYLLYSSIVDVTIYPIRTGDNEARNGHLGDKKENFSNLLLACQLFYFIFFYFYFYFYFFFFEFLFPT